MAKRAPIDEKPFRPLDAAVLQAVVRHSAQSLPSAPTTLPQPEPVTSAAITTVGEEPRLVPAPMLMPQSIAKAEPKAAPALTTRLDHEKRILFTREETHVLERLVQNLAVRLQAQVKVSHVIRALTSLLIHAEAHVDLRAGQKGALIRPSNGDFSAIQQFERELALIIAHALRDSGVPWNQNNPRQN